MLLIGLQWVRWELALYDHEINSGVEYVPGSHKRFRNAFENDVLVPEKAKAGMPDFERALPAGVGSAGMSAGQGGESRDKSDCHFRKTATEYDRKPGIKRLSCTAK